MGSRLNTDTPDDLLLLGGKNFRRFEVLSELLRGPTKERPIAFFGAGLSVQTGYPTWSMLIGGLVERVGELNLLKGRNSDELSLLRQSEDLLYVSGRCRHLMETAGKCQAYFNFLNRMFRPRRTRNSALESLVSLPFRHYITTNYDGEIERAYTRVHRAPMSSREWSLRNAEQFEKALSDPKSQPECVHLHGSYRAPTSIVLTERDYQDRYMQRRELIEPLERIFTANVVVFIGYSLNDMDLMSVLRAVTVSRKTSRDRPHFALLPLSDRESPDRSEVEHARLMEKYRIAPIFYRMLTNRYLGLEHAIERLSALTRARRKRRAAVARPSRKGAAFRYDPKSLNSRLDDDDPNKGLFGGRATRNGRTLKAEVVHSGDSGWFEIRLEVRALDPRRKPLRKNVTFYMHPSFSSRHYNVHVVHRDRAPLTVWAYGAFTVGAVTDEGDTALELDLASLADAPREFRLR